MSLPPPTVVGEFLSSDWLNNHRRETKKNTIVSATGLSFNRSEVGTTLYGRYLTPGEKQEGKIVTVVNDTGRDLPEFYFAGIQKLTSRDEMVGNFSQFDYVIRKAEAIDLNGRIVMLAEPIPDKGAGDAFISSDGLMTRVEYDESGDQDDLRFATIDTEADNGYIAQASGLGPILVIDVEDKQDDHPDWRWAQVRFPIFGSGGIDEPVDATYEDEHSEEANTEFYSSEIDGANTDVIMDFSNPPDNDADDGKKQGLKITMATGSSYFDTGDQTLYSYVADFHYDNNGRLLYVEKERRVVIDVPEDCT